MTIYKVFIGRIRVTLVTVANFEKMTTSILFLDCIKQGTYKGCLLEWDVKPLKRCRILSQQFLPPLLCDHGGQIKS